MKVTGLGILVACLLALLPFTVSQSLFTGSITTKYFLILLGVDALLLFAAYRIFTGEGRMKKGKAWFLAALIGVIGVQYLSSYLGVHFENSLWSDLNRQTGVLFLTHLAALAVGISVWLTQADWTLIRRTITVSGGVFGLCLTLGVEGFGLVDRLLWGNLSIYGFTLGNTTFAGTYLLGALTFASIELVRSWDIFKWRVIGVVSIALMMLSPVLFHISLLTGHTAFAEILRQPEILLGSARASSVAVYASFAFVLSFLIARRLVPEKVRMLLGVGWGVLWLVSIMFALTLLFTPGSVVQTKYIESSSSARLIVWDTASEAFLQKPVFGWGPENFKQAFEQHFDNQLYLRENLNEVWFDRAHNVFLDVLVATGILGLVSFGVLIIALYVSVWRAYTRKRIPFLEALILSVFPVAHILELQTGFDTITSYTLLAILGGYVLSLERDSQEEGGVMQSSTRKISALILVLFVLASLKSAVVDEWARHTSLYNTFAKKDVSLQTAAIGASLTHVSDFETLRISSASFMKGALAQIAQAQDSKAMVKVVLPYMEIYERAYQDYIEANPEYYRARMNYVYVLLNKTALGDNSLTEARQIVEDSYALSPNNPLTYALHALVELYSGDLQAAYAKAEEAIALNPDITFSQNVKKYLDVQAKKIPRVSILKLENL